MEAACAPAADALRGEHGRAGHHRVRDPGTEAPLSPPHPLERRLVVPGLLRARGRLGPRRPRDPRGPRRRPLRRQRSEDLDDRRAARGLDLLPGAHEPGSEAAGGDLLPPHRHALARGHRASDPDHGWERGDQRHLLRGRPGAGGEPRRRGRQGLDLREVPPRARAYRHRGGGPFQGPAPAHPRDRPERDQPRAFARGRPPVPGAPRGDRGRADGARVHHPPDRVRHERRGHPRPRGVDPSRSRGPRSSSRSPTC